MSDMACCPLQTSDETATFYATSFPAARKEYVCEECRESIGTGSRYELYKMLFDGSWCTSRTCMSCSEIRDHFRCGSCVIGELWSDLEENFYPDMKAGGPCMEGLSPANKARLFERRTKWLLESDE